MLGQLKSIINFKQKGVNIMGELRIMSPEGDLKVILDADKSDEVEAARKQFNELTGKNYIAFSVKKDGEKNEKIHKFDPNMEKMILIPMLKGG
jgi:hypothetical protein